MRYEYIKSMRLAGALMLDGFKIYGIEKDKFNPDYDVYLFRGSDELSSAILKHINGENGGKINGNNNKNCKNTSKERINNRTL